MTDAKELAARLRELANNEAYRSREHELDAAHAIMDAADALEAQAGENERLRRMVEANVGGKPLEGDDLAWADATALQQQAFEIAHLAKANAKLMDEPAKLLRTVKAQADRIAAMEQAAAPLDAYLSSVFDDMSDEAELPVQLGTLRALARAVGGGE